MYLFKNLLFVGAFDEKDNCDDGSNNDGHNDDDCSDNSSAQAVHSNVKILFFRSFPIAESAYVRRVGTGVVNDEDAATSIFSCVYVVIFGPSVIRDFFH